MDPIVNTILLIIIGYALFANIFFTIKIYIDMSKFSEEALKLFNEITGRVKNIATDQQTLLNQLASGVSEEEQTEILGKLQQHAADLAKLDELVPGEEPAPEPQPQPEPDLNTGEPAQ